MEIPNFKLNSGFNMPSIGLGTYRATDDECYEAVKFALKVGYRHIDTADMYQNHIPVGKAIRDSNIPREEIFVTTKIMYNMQEYDNVKSSFNRIFDELDINYIDLLLIHWPDPNVPMEETFKAFEEIIESKKVRSFGVSNFTIGRLKKALKISKIPICVNQIECHPNYSQEELRSFCEENGIFVTAYSPFGQSSELNNQLLVEISKKHDKTPAQIILRWLFQRNIISIPKSSNPNRIESNSQIFDFELSNSEVEEITNLGDKKRYINPPFSEF